MFSFLKRGGVPDEPLTDLQRANQALTRKAYAEAIALYVRHAETCPSEAAKAFAGAAECCLRSNALAVPVAAAPGVTLVSEGDRKGAEYYFRLALRADPSNVRALWGLSESLPEASAERLDLLERLVTKQPGTLNLIALGDFWRTHRKECEKAYQFYKQAIEHNPKDKAAYLRLNDICRRMGRENEAQVWSQRWTEAKKTKRRIGGKSD